jgi:WD40 repeat protein
MARAEQGQLYPVLGALVLVHPRCAARPLPFPPTDLRTTRFAWCRPGEGGSGAADTAHDGAVAGVSVDACNRLLVSGGADGRVRMWDFKRRRLTGEVDVGVAISRTCHHADSALLAVSCIDDVIRMYDVEVSAAWGWSAVLEAVVLRLPGRLELHCRNAALKPIGHGWSYLACRIGHLSPIWQPYIGSSQSTHGLQRARHSDPVL